MCIYHGMILNYFNMITKQIMWQQPGGRLNKKTVLPGMAIPMLKIRRPNGRLIFNMEIAIPGKTVFLIETAPWLLIAGDRLTIHLWFRFDEKHVHL